MEQFEEKNRVSLIELFIPIFYIINQYSISGISLGLILMLVVVVWNFINTKKFNVFTPLLALFGFMLFHDILKMFVVTVNTSAWIERFVYLLFLSSIIGRVNRDNLYKIWKIVGLFAMVGMFYQSFQVYFLGQAVSMIKLIPFATSTSSNYTLAYMRPHSFFLEPAAYATWILPLLYMAMERKKTLFAILISISVMLSTSSTGLIMVGVVWLYFSFIDAREEGRRWNGLVLVSILIIGVGALSSLEIFSTSFEKITNISLNDTSNAVRLSLGFQLFFQAPISYKLLGIPYSTIEDYLRSGAINLSTYGLSLSTSYLGFVNALGNCMLNYGIFGTVLYLRLFYRCFIEADKSLKCYVLLCVLSIFGQSVFWNGLFVTQMAVILGSLEEPRYKVFTLGKRV